jgi:hypothetical protein
MKWLFFFITVSEFLSSSSFIYLSIFQDEEKRLLYGNGDGDGQEEDQEERGKGKKEAKKRNLETFYSKE